MMNPFLIFVLLILLVIFYCILIYNRLVSLQKSAESAWSDIEVQLKRRYNLIPALVATVKGYKNYEATTLQKVIEARSKALGAKNMHEQMEANSMLTQALGKLFALVENYPDLKASTNFLELQKELANIENDIQNARRYYNAVVRDYNTRLDSFPDMFIAKRFGFRPKEYFEVEPSEKEKLSHMPKIEF